MFKKKLGKKAYEAQKIRSDDIDLKSCNLNGWQRNLINFCSKEGDVSNDFSRHIGSDSRYPLKKELLKNLQLVYALLSGELVAEYPDLALSVNYWMGSLIVHRVFMIESMKFSLIIYNQKQSLVY